MIKTEKLCKDYGPVHALRNLTIDVPAGEIFCFLGPNGAGKTTSIKLMTGLLRPTSGRVLIDGVDMHKNPVDAKKVIGYVPDTPYLYDRLTSEEYFEFTGDLYGVPRDTMRDELEKSFAQFGLNDHRDSLIKDLSHGLRQRLIYAATFLHNPRVFFVDEPLIGLDPYSIRLLKDLLIAKARAGMTIFLTTHILALAQDIGDRIGIILQGELLTVGTTEQLLNQSAQRSLEEVFLKLTSTEENGAPTANPSA